MSKRRRAAPRMREATARKIAEFAVMVQAFRGWTFSMRHGIEDDWGAMERTLKRLAQKKRRAKVSTR